MYARILYVGAPQQGDADFKTYLIDVLRSLGHAVQVCPSLDALGNASEVFDAICRTFGPTAVVWDVDTHPVVPESLAMLESTGVCRVALTTKGDTLDASGATDLLSAFDYALLVGSREPEGLEATLADRIYLMSPKPQARYASGYASNPYAIRDRVLVTQGKSDTRASQIADACKLPGISHILAFDASWEEGLEGCIPGASPAFYMRQAKYYAVFEGDDEPTIAEIVQRVAEGVVVLAQEGALSHIADTLVTGCVVRFAEGALAEVIAQLEKDDERFGAAVEEQRRAVDGARSLERSIDDVVYRVDGAWRRRANAAVLAFEDPAAKVALITSAGAGDFADGLLLDAVAHQIRLARPNTQFLAISADPAYVTRTFGFDCADMKMQRGRIDDFLKTANALVTLGGMLIDGPAQMTAGAVEFMTSPGYDLTGQAALSLLARMYGVPTLLMGVSGGPLYLDGTRHAVELAGIAGAQFISSDPHTRSLIEACGVNGSQVRERADMLLGARDYIEAAAAQTIPLGLSGGSYMMVSIDSNDMNLPEYCEWMAQSIELACEKTSVNYVLVPTGANDGDTHRRIYDMLPNPLKASSGKGDARVRVIDDVPSQADLLALIAGSRGYVGTKLHCAILHHMAGKPVVGIAGSNDAIAAHLMSMRQERYLLTVDALPQDIAAALVDVLSDDWKQENTVAAIVLQKQALVDRAYRELFAAMDASRAAAPSSLVFYPRTISADEQEIALLRAQVEDLTARLEAATSEGDKLKEELGQVSSSRSYRFGNAVLPQFIRKGHQKGEAKQ